MSILVNNMKMKLSEELKWRGFVNQTTLKSAEDLDRGKIAFYWGVDPSADSMTVGNLAAAMMVRHFIDHGHKAVLLVGGATGIIGDPDGKTKERELKSLDEIKANSASIERQYKNIFAGERFEMVNNYDWFKGVNYVEFLRDYGKHMPMRQMLGRDFVQNRLREGGAGISYAEFSYSLMQGYDFLHLYKTKGVALQVCGADQWGNSIAGVDLIRRVLGGEAHVWSAPLIVNKATGTKFGKSEDGAIWLDEAKTSVYQFYQFWLNVDDESAEDYLKIYTLLSKSEIESLVDEFNRDKGGRKAQKTLAYEVTKLIHGTKRADEVRQASEVLFGEGDFFDLSKSELQILKKELPTANASGDLPGLLVECMLAGSKSEARNFLNAGAITINGQKAGPDNLDLLVKGNNLIKRGKNKFAIIQK